MYSLVLNAQKEQQGIGLIRPKPYRDVPSMSFCSGVLPVQGPVFHPTTLEMTAMAERVANQHS